MKPIERFLRETDRVPLMPMPTPLHPMHYQPSGKDVSLFIKRDDMTGVGPGGNKIRSLEFLLGEARSKGASKIHAAEPVRKEGNLLLEELLVTKIHFLGPCDGAVRNRRMEELAAAYQSAGEQIYVVRNGATTGRGALGYTAAVVEMKRQCEDLGIGRMTIFAPGGNGGVAAGLIYGNQLMDQPFRIVIVSVEDDRETLTAHIRSTISEAEEITGLPMDVPVEQAAEITDAYRGGGWGKNTVESQQAVLSFARSEGIFIENVYTSKVLVGMMDWIEQEKVSGPVCYLHTGGLGSLFAQY